MTSYVYFIKPVGLPGPIKIGCSSMPHARLTALMEWAAFPLELMGKVYGSYSEEKALHIELRDYRSHGEWFHPEPAVLDAIQRLMSGETRFAQLIPYGAKIVPSRRRKAA
jgi:hypothetical protein